MRRSVTGAVFLAALLAAALPAGTAGSGDLDLPPVHQEVLPNGIRFFHIRDELPQVTLVVSVGFGKLYEKKDNAGISELIARAISIGGSRHYPGGALHDAIDDMGGRLGVSSSWEGTTISIKVLDRFRDRAFAIAADLLCDPLLESPSLDNARSIVADSIARRNEDPAETAFERARALIFGGEGYGSVPTPEIVRTLSREAIREAWARHAVGRNVMIGVSSSIDAAEASRLCRRYFGRLPQGAAVDYGADRARAREAVARHRGRIFLYPRDLPQSTVVVGAPAPGIGCRGEQALGIMNYVLGGGSFNARLMSEIRVRRGLAYSVQSVIRLRRGTGVFLAFAQTENGTAGRVLGLLTGEIERMSREPISREELEWARSAIGNSFIFRFDTPWNVLSNAMELSYNRLPADYFTSYRARLAEVKAGDILRESADLFRDGLIVVVVGDASVEKDLKEYGEVVTVK